MRDREIDEILKQAAHASHDVDPVLVDRISKSIGSDLQPVKALPSPRTLTGGLVLICVAVALTGGILLRPYGFQKMTTMELGLLVPVLVFLISLSAATCVSEAIPGRRQRISPELLVISCCIALAGAAGLLFHDYRTAGFLTKGVKCLALGLFTALPASLGTWWLLRREFIMSFTSAHLARGALAGLAGVTMLQIHCPILEAPHIMVWHIAVVPLTGAIGIIILAFRNRSRQRASTR